MLLIEIHRIESRSLNLDLIKLVLLFNG